MYRRIEDFKKDWAFETEATLKVFEAIQDEKKIDRLDENVRSLGRLAWHITQTLTEMPHRASLLDTDPLDKEPIPQTMTEIIKAYQDYSLNLINVLEQKWSDQQLDDEVDMYDNKWKKGIILSILILHQTHHRGQMTTLMRLQGMKVPGIYGPSKEEWLQYGMPPME